VRRRQLGVIVVMVVVTCSGLRRPCAAGCVLETDLLVFAKGGHVCVRDGGAYLCLRRWGELLLCANNRATTPPLLVYRRLQKKKKRACFCWRRGGFALEETAALATCGERACVR